LSVLFQRYPDSSRRAIFYAYHAAIHAGSEKIDSNHLLEGLLVEPATRANLLFKLDQLFPDETSRMRSMKPSPDKKNIPLSRDGKRIVAHAAEEANQLDDYWIDTDHLVLGILRERTSAAAQKLYAHGFTIEKARKDVSASSEHRESYGPVPALWQLAKPITRVGRIAGMWYVVLVVVLLELLARRTC
jgi:ATP-dependent Clp protease ATP-binding subunit ClpC